MARPRPFGGNFEYIVHILQLFLYKVCTAYSFNKKDSLIHEVDLINLLTYPYRDWWTEHLDNNSLSGLAVEDSGW